MLGSAVDLFGAAPWNIVRRAMREQAHTGADAWPHPAALANDHLRIVLVLLRAGLRTGLRTGLRSGLLPWLLLGLLPWLLPGATAAIRLTVRATVMGKRQITMEKVFTNAH